MGNEAWVQQKKGGRKYSIIETCFAWSPLSGDPRSYVEESVGGGSSNNIFFASTKPVVAVKQQ